MRQRQVEDKVFFKEHGGKIVKAEVVATRPAEFARCAPVPILHACCLWLVLLCADDGERISFCICRRGVVFCYIGEKGVVVYISGL